MMTEAMKMTAVMGAPMEVALFGAGRIGKIHAANLAAQAGVRLKYVVDVHAESAQALAALHGASVTSVEVALADPAIKAVVVASSTDTHADLIVRAAAAGKAIFCEKPVDLTIERARACAAAVEQHSVLCMIGFQRRFDPTFVTLKARLVAGEIGTPEVLIVTSRDPGPPPVNYIKVSGGIFKDMLIHDFDIFRWILDDEAISLHATGSCLVDAAIGDAGDLDCAVVTIRTRSGRLCQINASRRAAYGYDQRFEILGSRGMLQAGNHKPTEVSAHTAQHGTVDNPENFFLERYRAAYAQEMAHFFDAVIHGTPLRITVRDGLKALELAEAATTSWRENRIVAL
ncbi:MAG: myo-inositol 2-dehydrogenase/D-chiro-inositol 1-dehydrogenase [Bradyrhizobium sp.]|jgi:myo-inositol 2-dehydrogenase/D-chiro-inositol 1-dehydrogenase